MYLYENKLLKSKNDLGSLAFIQQLQINIYRYRYKREKGKFEVLVKGMHQRKKHSNHR